MKLIQRYIILLIGLSSTVHAIVNGTSVPVDLWRSVVLLELIDPDNGLPTSCSAVIISDRFAVTTASCVLHEETGKQVSKLKVCIGHKRPFKSKGQRCLNAVKIYSHHNYISQSGTSVANNLAYIQFSPALDLIKMNIQPAELLTPNEFSNWVSNANRSTIKWVGFDSAKVSTTARGFKTEATVEGAEFDYELGAVRVNSTHTRPGNHYQGLAAFIESQSGDWKLLGLVSQSSPDNIVSYYPEFNPCDEDPITVSYPKPIMQVSTLITAYPVAACGMVDFIKVDGFDELACKKLLLRELDWVKAVAKFDPIALRQRALSIYAANDSVDDAGEIYKLLYLAHQQGDNQSTLILSKFLFDGNLLEKDTQQAQQYLQPLIENNDPYASLLLAKIQLFADQRTRIEPSSPGKDKQIFSLLEIAANQGIAEAQYLLARLYQLGIGVKKNPSKTYLWFAYSAIQGHADGQYQLGMIWSDGRGVRPYPEVAMFWIQQAAAQGQLEAQNYLGLLKPNS